MPPAGLPDTGGQLQRQRHRKPVASEPLLVMEGDPRGAVSNRGVVRVSAPGLVLLLSGPAPWRRSARAAAHTPGPAAPSARRTLDAPPGTGVRPSASPRAPAVASGTATDAAAVR